MHANLFAIQLCITLCYCDEFLDIYLIHLIEKYRNGDVCMSTSTYILKHRQNAIGTPIIFEEFQDPAQNPVIGCTLAWQSAIFP